MSGCIVGYFLESAVRCRILNYERVCIAYLVISIMSLYFLLVNVEGFLQDRKSAVLIVNVCFLVILAIAFAILTQGLIMYI